MSITSNIAAPTTETASSSVRWKIFAVLFLLVVVNMIDRASISIAMPTIAKELNLSGVMQGLILSSFFWTYALMQIPSGMLADKFGPRKTVSISTVLWGIAQAVLGMCSSGASLIGARLLLGGSEAPVFPAGAKLNAIWLNKGERARGAVLMDAGGPFGAALGGILIAEMILYFQSWRLTFVIAGVGTVLLGLLAWYTLRDKPSTHPGVNQAELDIINSDRDATVTEEEDKRPLLHVLPARSLTGMLLGRCAWAMMFFGLLTWGPSYLSHALNLDLKGVGYATLIIFCAGGLGSLCGGFLADRLVVSGMSRARTCRLLLTISGLCTLTTFFVLPSIPDVNTSVLLLSCAAFVLMWGSLYWSFPALLAPRSRVGVVGGMMNMAGSIGGICIPLIVGLLLDLLGGSYDPVLYFFAGCAVVFVVMTNLIDLRHVR